MPDSTDSFSAPSAIITGARTAAAGTGHPIRMGSLRRRISTTSRPARALTADEREREKRDGSTPLVPAGPARDVVSGGRRRGPRGRDPGFRAHWLLVEGPIRSLELARGVQ